MEKNEKNIAEIKKEIAAIDEEIKKLNNSVKIVGELDQDGNLIIGEDEALPEAVERQGKINRLLSNKRELEKSLFRLSDSF